MLKHLKGARVMQDCTTGQLFVDTGTGGECKPMGASSWNDLKDKPFDEGELVETVLYEKIGDHPEEMNRIVEPGVVIPLEIGKEYTVSVFGQIYKCVAYSAYGDTTNVALGCESEINGNGYVDGEEPFAFSTSTILNASTVLIDVSYMVNNFHVDELRFTISEFVPEVKTLDPKYLPKHLQFGEGELVPETNVEGFTLMEGTLYAVQNPFSLTLTVGDTYVVNWDGAEYELVCETLLLGSDDVLIKYIGNVKYFGVESERDIPFVIAADDAGLVQIATESTANSHTISIKGNKTIERKYLPPMTRLYVGPEDGSYLYEDPLYERRIGFVNFRDRFLSGERFYCVLDDFLGDKNMFVNILTFHADVEDNYGDVHGVCGNQWILFRIVNDLTA